MVVIEKSYAVTPTGVGRRDFSKNVERYDEEPTLLLLEEFEHLPPTWLTQGTPGYSVERVTDRAWRGGACLRLRTGTAVIDNYASYYQYFGLVRSMKLLADVMTYLAAEADGAYFFGLNLCRYTGTEYITFSVLYDIRNEKWRYRLPSGAYVDVPNGAQSLAAHIFHHMWLSVDFLNNQFLYLQSNQKFMDLKGCAPYRSVNALKPQAAMWVNASSGENHTVDFYIDNVRVAEVI